MTSRFENTNPINNPNVLSPERAEDILSTYQATPDGKTLLDTLSMVLSSQHELPNASDTHTGKPEDRFKDPKSIGRLQVAGFLDEEGNIIPELQDVVQKAVLEYIAQKR